MTKLFAWVETAQASGGREAGFKSLGPPAPQQLPSSVQKNFPLDASLPPHLFHSEEGGGDFPTTLRSAREGQEGLSYSDDSHCSAEK